MKKNILIVGGTSGVGLELAQHYIADGHTVCVSGRHNPALVGAQFEYFSITDDTNNLAQNIDKLLHRFQDINTLIYAAGFRQHGHIDVLNDASIQQMINTGLTVPALLVQRLKNKLSSPLKIMLITSYAQYTPIEYEPVYCAVKAGLGMLGESLVRDKNIGKVLVAAPSQIDTSFWRGSNTNTRNMLNAKWVCDRIVELSSGAFKYKYAKMLANPTRVEVQLTLDNHLQIIPSTAHA